MSRPAAAPPAPHASEGVGQPETEESLGLPHLPHMPHRVLASGGAEHAAGRKTQSLAALAARWEARTAARQAAGEALPETPGEAERETVPEPPAPPPAPTQPIEGRDAWGLTEGERTAALARLAGASPTAEQPAEALPPADWWRLPHGEARGRAFAEARTMPGACQCCAGRRWWREADEAPPGRCMACHPPPPGLAVTVTETRAGTYQPGDPDPLRDGLLRGARDHRNLR